MTSETFGFGVSQSVRPSLNNHPFSSFLMRKFNEILGQITSQFRGDMLKKTTVYARKIYQPGFAR
jgi:hypothetical protein